MRPAIAALSLVIATACGGGRDTPTSPGPPDPAGARTGVWLATLSDPENGAGTMRMDLAEYPIDGTRSLVGGTWSSAFAESARNGSGSLGGTITGARLAALAGPSPVPVCQGATIAVPGSFALSLTITQAGMTGTYLYTSCSESVTGTIELRRQ